MAERGEHVAQARSNRVFETTIDAVQYPDWAITVMYYQGVHLVRAWLCGRGEVQLNDHVGVRKLLNKHAFPRHVLTAYLQLESLSRLTRYECLSPEEHMADVLDAQKYVARLWAYIAP